jgi:hypothetical protein
MTGEESANVILEIFQKSCKKAGDSMSNKLLHDAYFKKTQSGLGFAEGLKYLVDKKWLAADPTAPNTHVITKTGLHAEV